MNAATIRLAPWHHGSDDLDEPALGLLASGWFWAGALACLFLWSAFVWVLVG